MVNNIPNFRRDQVETDARCVWILLGIPFTPLSAPMRTRRPSRASVPLLTELRLLMGAEITSYTRNL